MGVTHSRARSDHPTHATTVQTSVGDPVASPSANVASDDEANNDNGEDEEADDDYDDEYDCRLDDATSDSLESFTSTEDNGDLYYNGDAMEDMLSFRRYNVPSEGQFPIDIVGPRNRRENFWSSNTATIRDLAMMWFINHITDKHEWWRTVHDEESVITWKSELDAIVETGSHPTQTGFSNRMFKFCLREVRHKGAIWAKMAMNNSDGSGGVVSVLDMATAVFKSDGRIPATVVTALREAVKPFEDAAEKDNDCEPTSDGKVFNLVDPSLWPFVYGRSRMIEDGEMDATSSLDHIGRGNSVSPPQDESSVDGCPHNGVFILHDAGVHHQMASNECMRFDRFQWLPADISFEPNGTGKPTVSSYINNVHPLQHKALYPVIEQLLDVSLPLFSAAYHRT